LGVEVTVFVDDSFGGSGGAGGEKNSRKIGGAAVSEQGRRGGKLRTRQRETGRKRTAGGDANIYRGKRSPADMAKEARERETDQGARSGTLDAGEEIFEPHAGIDDDRNGAERKKRKGCGDEREALADHDQGAVTGLDASVGEFFLPCGDLCGEFGKREGKIIDVARGGTAAGDFEGGGRGRGRSHEPEVAGDVGVGGGSDHRGAGLPMVRVEQRKTPRIGGVEKIRRRWEDAKVRAENSVIVERDEPPENRGLGAGGVAEADDFGGIGCERLWGGGLKGVGGYGDSATEKGGFFTSAGSGAGGTTSEEGQRGGEDEREGELSFHQRDWGKSVRLERRYGTKKGGLPREKHFIQRGGSVCELSELGAIGDERGFDG
jgi:hypothetical protein